MTQLTCFGRDHQIAKLDVVGILDLSVCITSEAKAAFAEHGLEAMPDWPKYSPDLNPQEHVWSWVERALRKEERKSDTFQVFTRKLLVVARRYPSAAAFMPSMHGRVQEVLRCKGAMTKY